MKKILIISVMFLCVFFVGCDSANNSDNDRDKRNNDGIQNKEINENINDFEILLDDNIYVDEEVEMKLSYNTSFEVSFKINSDNDNIQIKGNKILGIKEGNARITVKEEKSGITKCVDIIINSKPIECIDDFEIILDNNIYVGEEVEIKLSYDSKSEVFFEVSSDNDNIQINGNKILGIKEGNAKIIVTEEKSGISKLVDIVVSIKKNEYININNGYYIYGECAYVAYSNVKKDKFTYYYKNKYSFLLDDEYELRETFVNDYDKAYDLYLNNEYCNKTLLFKDDNIYLGIFGYKPSHRGEELEVVLFAVYKLDFYSVFKPNEKNKNLIDEVNIYSGYYIYNYPFACISQGASYHCLDYYQRLTYIDRDDEFVLQDLNDLSKTNLDYLIGNNRQNNENYKYTIQIEDIVKWYNVYRDGILQYGLFVTNDNLLYVNITTDSTDRYKYMIDDVVGISYFNEISVDLENDELTDFYGDYKYEEIIYCDDIDISNQLINSYAFSIYNSNELARNNQMINNEVINNLNIVNRYDLVFSSNLHNYSLLIGNDGEIYYVAFDNQINNGIKEAILIFMAKISKFEFDKEELEDLNGDYFVAQDITNSSALINYFYKNFKEIINVDKNELIKDETNQVANLNVQFQREYGYKEMEFVELYSYQILEENNVKIYIGVDKNSDKYIVYQNMINEKRGIFYITKLEKITD